MIRNYCLVAIRNLLRNKFFSVINIAGLAVGMSICMAIIMLIADQMTYDRHLGNYERIYRVNTYLVDGKGNPKRNVEGATSPMPLAAALTQHYTGVEKAVRIKRGFGNNWLELENQNVNIPLKGFFADQGVLELFGHELLYGDPATALNAPYSVVLTKNAAEKLFQQENPLGATVKVGDAGTYTVTGVIKETAHKSHVVFEALASMSSVNDPGAHDNWLDFWNAWTYIVLAEGSNPDDIQRHLEEIYNQHIAPAGTQDSPKAKFSLQQLSDITPGAMVNNPIGPSLPWVFVYFLGGLAAVVMVTSCFNFTNLSIARSLKRAKEIGVRKVTGATRYQIFFQFLAESIITCLCSLAVALVLLIALKPLLLQLNFAKLFMWDLEANYLVYGIFLVFAAIVGVLAGAFPAVVLSGFQPIKVLKNFYPVKIFSRMTLRKTLLVSQFTMSIIFIMTVIVMYKQLKLFLHADYGFNMKNSLIVRLNDTSAKELKNELLKYPNFESVSAASHMPSAGESHGGNFKKDLREQDWTNLNNFTVDEDYLENMEINLVAGKFFESKNGNSNHNFVVINERAVKALKYSSPLDAIGEELIVQWDSSRRQIIGVVKDYNHRDLFIDIEPLALVYDPDNFEVIQMRYAGDREKAVAALQAAWLKVNPELKIDYDDLEARIKYFYNTIFGDVIDILGFIAGLAIMISCLGLLGIATYTIETRMKEISLRKVLGSSDGELVFLLSKGFLKMLVIAILIGAPLAALLNNFWLQFIAYRTSIGIDVILGGSILILLLGAITIGSQTLRAGFTNPVDNLKNE